MTKANGRPRDRGPVRFEKVDSIPEPEPSSRYKIAVEVAHRGAIIRIPINASVVVSQIRRFAKEAGFKVHVCYRNVDGQRYAYVEPLKPEDDPTLAPPENPIPGEGR